MPQVKRATIRGTLDSFGNAENKLIRQLGFPDVYDDRDTLLGEYHDRVTLWDSKHSDRCFREHTKTGAGGFGEWAANAKKTALIAFARDLLKADPNVKWTGCRVLATVDRSCGKVNWMVELFAKHPDTKTKCYSGINAPNVENGFRFGSSFGTPVDEGTPPFGF